MHNKVQNNSLGISSIITTIIKKKKQSENRPELRLCYVGTLIPF